MSTPKLTKTGTLPHKTAGEIRRETGTPCHKAVLQAVAERHKTYLQDRNLRWKEGSR